MTGILYAHQHAPILPQFEKLTATGKNYVVTKTGSVNEEMAASEDKAEHAENVEDAEESSEETNDKEEGADEEAKNANTNNDHKENKIAEKGQ